MIRIIIGIHIIPTKDTLMGSNPWRMSQMTSLTNPIPTWWVTRATLGPTSQRLSKSLMVDNRISLIKLEYSSNNIRTIGWSLASKVAKDIKINRIKRWSSHFQIIREIGHCAVTGAGQAVEPEITTPTFLTRKCQKQQDKRGFSGPINNNSDERTD